MIDTNGFIKTYLKNLEARQGIIENQLKSILMEVEYNNIIIQNIKELIEREENVDEDTTSE